MSILIKGMEMPKTCGECEARHLAKCGVTLQWLLGPEDYYKTKKEDCPLVEIKTPHGRLIDEDALICRMDDSFRMAGLHGADYRKVKR